MRVKTFSVMMSTNGNDDNHLFRNSKLMFFVWIVLLFGLLVTISPLIASEPGEILGPESGYMDLRWQSNDKVVALKYEYEFIQDKLSYNYGEILIVKYDISVDTASRGYLPNRTYYLLSTHVIGNQIRNASYYWRILKSDIDTLEVITECRSLKGEFTLQLLYYRDKPNTKQNGEGGFMYFTPIDTTKVGNTKQCGPPAFQFTAYRVAATNTGANVHKHNSGKFYYDQLGAIPLSGKTVRERWERLYNSNTDYSNPKTNTYLPPQPDFWELAEGGIPGFPIKVLKNTTLNWAISRTALPAIISSVGISGNALGCSVSVNPNNTNKYILTTGNVTGNIRVTFTYTHNGNTYTDYNDHTIITYYNFHGTIS